MNVSDSEIMAGALGQAGYAETPDARLADVILVNTCAIRENAEERVIARLSQLNGYKLRRPEVVLGVCGCMSKHLSEKLVDRAPYVDLVVGPDSYRRLPDLIGRLSGEPALDVRLDRGETYVGVDPVRRQGVNAWVTVERGCDRFCTFCIVPYVRGRERCVPAAEVARQAQGLAEEGYREVTLLGQTVNAYRDGEVDFAGLLRRLCRIDGIERIRFTSPHPSEFTPGLIETMAEEPKVCKHVHLPVQSGSDRILTAMRRDYTSGKYLGLVDRIRAAMPGVALTTDIIVGFPGESEEDFRATVDLMARVRYDSAFTFIYSPRAGTAAYRELADDIPYDVKRGRLEAVVALQERVSLEINRSLIGQAARVLAEGESKRSREQFHGKTEGFKTAVFPRGAVRPNTFVDVRVTDATSHTLFGEVVA
ncbi:MAG: tRNA (N6-isopentenyl adenosine(37)-C2)-methylthiotransferase MiaB [Candidatus Handelsmanbacteria bacterium RIFCSPLOWO2_12_FULL_64_10]|uniref:tRNA-2-methylthio-N(6)-dimethylallyladenosine synthase n=1 Tax=Handelsmanbacteria sp. (strain RIFCSPLOWO2_12_FULL_64_10) TaxID=1817868 RepID=A0A1F6CAW2_HANXR|nr:MAG: tRNA (N6-isopentenyl adenosine(37)-C2)-methylthiotransferase MiaB [Candidatus Handelsmanbacteria bacterium RIFCSPLOWO2_12_FULL_64_10]